MVVLCRSLGVGLVFAAWLWLLRSAHAHVRAHSSAGIPHSGIELVQSLSNFDELKVAMVDDDAISSTADDRLIKIREAVLLVEKFGEQLESMMERSEEEDANVEPSMLFEQPVPCPIGTYCREGVSTPLTIVGDYSTPQPCYDGFFCPPGSHTPEGSGPCPSGYYCPAENATTIPLAIPCPAGSHCPDVANIKPKPCDPGTFSSESGQSICTLCRVGEICAYSGMTEPLPCTAGYVCDSLGLAVAERECPSSFYCEEGTATSDPDHPELKGPILCGPGVHCMGGVAHNTTIDWIPTQEEGKYAPQSCGEGHYCEAGSALPQGTGPCKKGSYCPPGSEAPILVPVGTYSNEEGAITPTLCSPGYYAPVEGLIECLRCSAGHSCEGYGTYEPRICAPGTYRSRFDSITCKLCPTGTFAPYSGSTDISQCLPCPDSRVCGVRGMSNLSTSEACSGGYHCSAGTDRRREHNHKCASGHVCGPGTNPNDQYEMVCEDGHYCERGTSLTTSRKSKCKPSHYCLSGTPSPEAMISHCPRQTTTDTGAVSLFDCRVQSVDICDKQRVDPKNMFEDLSYHPHPAADDSDSGDREILALTKVLPGITSNGTDGPLWSENTTIEVFRSCPTYGFFNESLLTAGNEGEGDAILLIGRNFRNTTALTCRFRQAEETATIIDNHILINGSFVSSTRIGCRVPSIKSLFQANEMQSNASIATELHLLIDASNDGHRFSGDERVIPYTSILDVAATSGRTSFISSASYGTYNLIGIGNASSNSADRVEAEAEMTMHKSNCQKASVIEESLRDRERGWYEVPFMRQAHLSFDWRRIPSDMVFEEHYKLAIYARPSRCDDTRCNENHERISDVEESPCQQPLQLPDWFLDPATDKRQVINMTLLALDDSLIRVEVQITDGLYLGSSHAFTNTMSIHIESPSRAKTLTDDDILYGNGEKRSLSPFISWEERKVGMEYFFAARLTSQDTKMISPPLNLPPRWSSLERGRLLLSMSQTPENTATPATNNDRRSKMGMAQQTNRFWDNPFHTTELAKEATDAYLESFHGMILRDDDTYGYEMSDLVLPYLPFFSKCRGFDSYLPIWSLFESSAECALPEVAAPADDDYYGADWWRRQYPPLPHRDDIKAVGPFDLRIFYPVADFCERKLYCQYEEELGQPDVLPRWFEADTGDMPFSVLRDPINYHDYTGRKAMHASADDGGGQQHVHSIQSPDTFIPAKVDRTAALALDEVCTTLCFPRRVMLDVSYYQVDQTTKRIVEVNLVYDEFDRDADTSEYELTAKLRPLDYRELIIKFAYSRGIFCILFVQVGLFTVGLAAVYWLVVRMTTQLESPPKLRFFRLWQLIFPPALGGFFMGLLPTAIMTIALTMLMRGHLTSSLDIVGGSGGGSGDDSNEEAVWSVFKSIISHYVHSEIEPDDVHSTAQGRTGLGFLAIAIACIYEGSKMFIPKIASSRREQEDATKTGVEENDDDNNNGPTNKMLTWWKRSNMIYTSIIMGLFLVLIVEWSYWRLFGNYIWEAIIFLKILSNFVGTIVEGQLGEALLSAPIMTAMGLVEGLVTLSANDFVDFLLSYIVGFGFLILDRMYIGPLKGDLFSWVGNKMTSVSVRGKSWISSNILGQDESSDNTASRSSIGRWNGSPDSRTSPLANAGATNGSDQLADNSKTVEPIIDSYSGYCCDTLSLFFAPFIILLLIMFRDETEMPALYRIKEQDMEYYIIFALLIIPFQITTEVFLHGGLELFHGWRLHDYLVYARYRFLQRETRWKGLDNSLDECIDERVRSLNQHCFSSQWYLMMTVHTSGIIYLVLGVQMMSRARYNLFGDPAMPLIIAFVAAMAVVVKKFLVWIGLSIGLWRVRKDRLNWHLLFRLKEEDDLQNATELDGIGDDIGYEMEKRITSETFRHKFLDCNRSWLIEQLPSLLTPRTKRRCQGYIIPQFSRILNNLNTDISSDSSDDDGPSFGETFVDSEQQKRIMTSWVEEARDRVVLKNSVEDLIVGARGSHCQRCLSNQLLSVKTSISFDDVFMSFKQQHSDPGDQVAFRSFWQKSQAYQTICQKCVVDELHEQRHQAEGSASGVDRREKSVGPIVVDERSKSVMKHWRDQARSRIRPVPVDISDDDADDGGVPSFPDDDAFHANEASSFLAKAWLRKARANKGFT